MALSAELGKAGITPAKLETTATITLDKVAEGFAITKLILPPQIPGVDKSKFERGQERRNPMPGLEAVQGRDQRRRAP